MKPLKLYFEWLESVGVSGPAWIGGDWHEPLHLLSKLLSEQLRQGRPTDTPSDVAFKISFDSMLRLAEECLGVPCLVTENDLLKQFPNIYLALLVYLLSLKHTTENLDTKSTRSIVPPKLVFEVKNQGDSELPKCPACQEHVYFVERIVTMSMVWHRQCFKCIHCKQQLRYGGYKKGKTGYECMEHAVRKVLDERESSSKTIRPRCAPPPVPLAKEDINKTESFSSIEEYDVIPQVDAPPVAKKKPVPPPKPTKIPPPVEMVTKEMCERSDTSSEGSGDIGIVYRSKKLHEKDIEFEIIEEKTKPLPPPADLSISIITEAPSTPVAPPRPKRASMLAAGTTPPYSPSTTRQKDQISPLPRPRTVFENENSVKYPDSFNPFAEDDENELSTAYDESKNPFADSDNEEETTQPVPAPRTSSSLSIPSVESDRPKSTPPPPPVDAAPMKPIRGLNVDELKFRTLRISKKKHRAPLPPVLAQRRKIMFTDNKQSKESSQLLDELQKLDIELTKIEREGRKLEMELLFLITQNPENWFKMTRVSDYVKVVNSLLDYIRQQNMLQYMWREAYLNDVHSETEFLLRCLVEKNSQEESLIEREKTLTNLLLFIIDEKARLTESEIDCRNERESSETRKTKRKLRLRLSLLSRKSKAQKTM